MSRDSHCFEMLRGDHLEGLMPSEASEADAIPIPNEGPMKPCFCFELKS